MCGIVAIHAYNPDAPPIDPIEMRTIRDRMTRRGPDGKGEWLSPDGRTALGHRRLAIIDLSERAAQPMTLDDREIVITCNGEIYNYRELREKLTARGHVFTTQSDTEVLLHLYAEKGTDMLTDLRGMFAFALWDGRKRALLIARDGYGIKPLYVADDGRTVRVASQVKALLAGGAVSRTTDPAGIVGFYLFGSVPEPWTTCRAIKAVPAGSYLWIDTKGCHAPTRYWSIAECFRRKSDRPRPDDNQSPTDPIGQAVKESVAYHLVADVPVGIFLSAGIDSGAIAGLMSEAGSGPISSLTLGCDESQTDPENETELSREVAHRYGLHHTELAVSDREVSDCLERFFEDMDQPSIDGLNTWLISSKARSLGWKVAVSGLGGDELFGGYPAFRDIPRSVRWMSQAARVPGLGKLSRPALQRLIPLLGVSPKAAGMVEYGGTYAGAYLLRRGLFMPWELPEVLPADLVEEGLKEFDPIAHIASQLEPDPGTAYGRVATLEASLYMRNQLLRDADWAGMAHSLEIRTPLVDTALTERLAPALAGGTKQDFKDHDFKKQLGRAPKSPLPDNVLERAKSGFTIPIKRWLRQVEALSSWREIPALARPGCHWSRQWAHVVMSPSL